MATSKPSTMISTLLIEKGGTNMGMEDVFNGAKSAMTFYGAYLNTVAEEIGMDRALSLHTKMFETMGTMQGEMAKEQSGAKKIDTKATFSLAKSAPESLGISMEVVEESPQSIAFKVGKCPIYESAQMMGMDAETIETLCRSGPLKFLDAMTKQLNPNLSYKLQKFRSGKDDFCEEVIVQD
jgi:hypothetical protein